jgi:glycosyltransferase involved in cell wall biosynthesis
MQTEVILFTETISPYRIPVFNEIAQDLKDRFLVLFLGETEKRRQWKIYKEKIKFRYEVLPGFLLQKKDSAPHFFNPTVFYKLMKYSPDIIVVGGYHYFGYFLAMLYARLFKRKIILWCESNRYEKRLNYPLKEAYKRWFVRNSTAYIVPGKASFDYLLSQGAVTDKIWIAPNAVDNDYFSQACDIHRETKEIFKQSKGYPNRLILYVGRLIDQKGVLDLLKAFQILSCKQSDLGLLLIGSGKEKERYKNFCKTNNLKNVFFEGFIHQEDLPIYYAVSNVFVLPTYSDPWGLVLNEAMASKLPVISSDAAGAAYDLIINGENGYIFKRGDIQQLVNYLKDILGDEKKRISMGQRSFSIIQDYSPLKCDRGFIKAIREI